MSYWFFQTEVNVFRFNMIFSATFYKTLFFGTNKLCFQNVQGLKESTSCSFLLLWEFCPSFLNYLMKFWYTKHSSYLICKMSVMKQWILLKATHHLRDSSQYRKAWIYHQLSWTYSSVVLKRLLLSHLVYFFI